MALQQGRQGGKVWVLGLLAASLLALSPLPSNGAAGTELRATNPRQGHPTARLHMSIQQGLLAVDLQDADLAEVLVQIGQQAGIPITLPPNLGKRISAQFTGATLEDGLRRLLRRSASSYTILYAQGPTGQLAMTAVQVFGAEGPPPPPIAAEGGAANSSQHFAQTFTTPQGIVTPAEAQGSDGINHLLEVLQRSREQGPQTLQGGERAAVRRIQEVIERALLGNKEPPPPNTPE